MSGDILKIEDLKVYYPVRKGMMGKTQYVKAVDGVSLNVHKGEVLGIVGESGCGKSTLGKAVCKLIPVTDGNIVLNDMDIARMSENQLRPLRKQIQMIFQDPYASLNPRMSVEGILSEMLRGIESKDLFFICHPREGGRTALSTLVLSAHGHQGGDLLFIIELNFSESFYERTYPIHCHFIAVRSLLF